MLPFRRFVVALCIAALTASVAALDNGLARTPQMGWNSWNKFACEIDEQLIKDTTNAMISTGLSGVGYKYINLDDCWQVGRNATTGVIIPDPKNFPSGIASLASYVHAKGLKFGVYSDAGFFTCQHRPGSLGHEVVDANTYAGWGVDYLKYDNCFTDGSKPEVRYPPMRDALAKSGRPILFSMCEWGVDDPATWAKSVGNSWRTTADIRDEWSSMIANIDINNKWADAAGPGGWNDPDMLEVGNGGMTLHEYRTHFALWCISKSPLIIGNDIRYMEKTVLDILTAPRLIAVNQDKLGKQAKIVRQTSSGESLVQLRPCSGSLEGQQWIEDEQGRLQAAESRSPVPRFLHSSSCDFGSISVISNRDSSAASCGFLRHNAATRKVILDKMDGCLHASLSSQNLWLEECRPAEPAASGSRTHRGGDVEFQEWKLMEDRTVRPTNNDQMCLTAGQDLDVWAGPLADGSHVVLLLNRGSTSAQQIVAHWADIGLAPTTKATVVELWSGAAVGVYQDHFSTLVGPHRHYVFKLTPSTAL